MTKKFIFRNGAVAQCSSVAVLTAGRTENSAPCAVKFFFRRFSLSTARQRGKIYAQVRK